MGSVPPVPTPLPASLIPPSSTQGYLVNGSSLGPIQVRIQMLTNKTGVAGDTARRPLARHLLQLGSVGHLLLACCTRLLTQYLAALVSS